MSRTICEGLTVLEMGAGSMAGSMAGMMLADNGARVLKVEPPEGDRLRSQNPPGFLVWNRGKESVVADLRTPSGQERLWRLASKADVVIEGFGAGVADGWGVGYEWLRELNPALVYCAIRGFASNGPYSRLKAYEGVVAAKAGLFSRGVFAFRQGPIFENLPLASHGAAHMATSGILAALVVRETTGKGQRVEASLWQGLNPFDYSGLAAYQLAVRKKAAGSKSTGAVAASRYSLMCCTKDGRWFVICTMLPHQAHALLHVVGLTHILNDRRFKDVPYFADAEDAEAYELLMWEAFRARTAGELVEAMRATPDIAFEVASTTEEAMQRPQVIHNGHVIEVDDSRLGRISQVGPVARFSATPSQIARSAPAVGENRGDLTGPGMSAQPGPVPEHPLSGVTIIEAGYFYAMPYGVTMAAALGARVIKLEDAKGDPQRWSFGAPETGGAKVTEGKESLSVDLKSPEGQRIAHQLVANADVFVLGFRPGVAERMNLDYETLRAINPNLVYVHASGYGPDGPDAHRAMYAQTASALVGGYDRQAGYWLRPEMVEGLSVEEIRAILALRVFGLAEGDANAALAVLTAIAMGVFAQRRHGVGQFIATTMLNANLYGLSDDTCRYAGRPPIALPDPEFYGLHALYRLYRAAQGWVFLAAPTQAQWEALVRTLGRADLASDGRFSDPAARRVNDDALAAAVAEALARKSAPEWEAELTAVGIGCASVYEGTTSQFAATDPGLRECGLVSEVDHPTLGRMVRYGVPVVLSDTPAKIAPGCLNGQHTDTVLSELGYSHDEIAVLKDRHVVFGPPNWAPTEESEAGDASQ